MSNSRRYPVRTGDEDHQGNFSVREGRNAIATVYGGRVYSFYSSCVLSPGGKSTIDDTYNTSILEAMWGSLPTLESRTKTLYIHISLQTLEDT